MNKIVIAIAAGALALGGTALTVASEALFSVNVTAVEKSASVNWNQVSRDSVNWNLTEGSVNWNQISTDSVNWNREGGSVNWNGPAPADSVNWNGPAPIDSVNWN